MSDGRDMTDKQAVRERIWDRLAAKEIARFPFPPHGRIPNFDGAERGADRLAGTNEWEHSTAIKANPDAPQLPVRRRALRAGKTVFMAAPRLAAEEPFLELDPDRIDDVQRAPTVSSVEEYARPVGPGDLPRIDLIVVGSVAVTSDGARIGKGEGYSDLEYALLADCDRVDVDTTVATTVHDVQVIEANVGVESHDVPVDQIVTPTRTIPTMTPHDRPPGLFEDQLSRERIAEIPILDQHTFSDPDI